MWSHTNQKMFKDDKESSVVSQQAEPPQIGIPHIQTLKEEGY